MICTISVRLDAIADRQRVLAPNPVEAFLRHAERDDDVHIVAVVLLRRVFQRGGNRSRLAGIVVHQVGDAKTARQGVLTSWKPVAGIDPCQSPSAP
jgi:hypothetical protein